MSNSDIVRAILDHIVILVSYKTLQQLPTQLENVLVAIDGGTHADGRTVNKLIEFPDGVYIELIAFQDGIDPKKRRAHRWGQLKENTIVDWAYTLPNEKDFNVIQRRVEQASSEVIYYDPIPGGRIRPDGVELKWSVSSAYSTTGQALHPGTAPFWCLDRTPRHLRVPYKDEDGSQPSYTEHPSGVIGVSSLSVSLSEAELSTVANAYNGIHNFASENGTWPFLVHSGSKKGNHHVIVKGSRDGERFIQLTLLGDKGTSNSIEIVPGLTVWIDFEK